MASKKESIEAQYGKPLESVLIELFQQYQSQRPMARELGVSQGTISLWLKELGLVVIIEARLEKQQN